MKAITKLYIRVVFFLNFTQILALTYPGYERFSSRCSDTSSEKGELRDMEIKIDETYHVANCCYPQYVHEVLGMKER